MTYVPRASSLILVAMVVGSWAYGQEAKPDRPAKIGFHRAVYDADGKLLPWTSWDDALRREVNWYLKCPMDSHGYPVFAFTTFMDGQYKTSRLDSIPCTQNGMGILSYLKYWEYTGKTDARVLQWARKLGDYLVCETLTPNEGAYPRFTRSTGFCMDFPLFRASQGDARHGRNVIQPDKGGIAGYALLKLYEATGEPRYLEQAVHNADVLVRNMREGSQTQSPWPYRVDSVTGKHWGERSSNMVFILRLFDALVEQGRDGYRPARDRLWKWIKTYQIPSPEEPSKCLWVQFFEDYDLDTNRNSWAPLETARYLIERKEKLDPQWKTDAEKLIQFALDHFASSAPGGVTLMGEQDDDKSPWGGACSKLGGVAAMFYAAGGGERYKEIAYRNLTWMMYFIDDDGCPSQRAAADRFGRGGWQEDCHTDVLHNFLDAMHAVPEWAHGLEGPSDRQQIAALLAQWKDALAAKDIARLMTLYAEDFVSQGRNKAAVAKDVKALTEEAEFQNSVIVVDDATVTIEGEKATVLPISVSGQTGSTTLSLELAKRNGRWLVVGMED
jgi:ketosteroid isomerase-like protein